METRRQDGLGRVFEYPIPAMKIGKVIRTRPGNEAIDVTFMDGGWGRAIPVLRGWASTVDGFAHLTAPTVNDSDPAAPTYQEGNSLNGDVEQPVLNSNRLPPAALIDGQLGERDIYAVCMPAEGFLMGTSGLVCIGFLYDSRGEMLFPADGNRDDFTDFMLVRHSSDVQITIDKFGTTSIQHPSGTRITVGDTDAVMHENVLQPANKIDLTRKDANAKYQLRNNTTRKPGVIVVDSEGGRLVIDGKGKTMLTDAAQNLVQLDNNGNTLEISQANGNKTLMDDSGTNITDKNGNNVKMDGTGTTITDSNHSQIQMDATGVRVDAGAGILQLKGLIVQVNPIA